MSLHLALKAMSRCGLIFKSFVKNRFRYQQLLFRTDLAKTGYMLLAGGVLAAVTAGIPFPVLGIFFGQLVDDFDSEGCKSDGSTEDAALSSKIMQKVLTMIYISVGDFVSIYIHTGCWSLFGERLVC